MRLAIGFKFKHGNRKFLVKAITWKGGAAEKLHFIELLDDTEATEIFIRDYILMQNLLNNGIIINL
jgi:hypothetical protein